MSAAIELENLTLRAGKRTLLRNVTATFAPGRITLIVGPSGAGKTTLLRLVAGLTDSESAELHVEGEVRVKPAVAGRRPTVGMVFQHLALFDELSPEENVRFAAAHRPGNRTAEYKPGDDTGDNTNEASAEELGPPDRANPRNRPAVTARQLLERLGVPRDVRTAALSGGQRRRLAVARTIAADPDVLLYDEPTAGLDVATATQVAQFIRSVHDASGKTTVIVTHDYESLGPIADEVFVLEPDVGRLRPVAGDERHKLGQLIKPATEEPPDRAATRRPTGQLARAAAAITAFLLGTGRVIELLIQAPLRLLPLWPSPVWGLRFLVHYLRIVSGPSAVVYIVVAGMLAGFVATYFTFERLPYREYTEPLIIEELLTGLGFSLYRVLIPVLVTLLVAARCGAAVTADIGGKSYGQQLEAMSLLGAPPAWYVLPGTLYAFLVGTPLLVFVGFAAAKWTSMFVFTATHMQLGPEFWHLYFHKSLLRPDRWLYAGTEWVLAKSFVCGLGIAAITYERGSSPKRSPTDVNRAITTAILWTTLFVLSVHFAFAFFEFSPP